PPPSCSPVRDTCRSDERCHGRRSSVVVDSAPSGANARLNQRAAGCPPEKLRARCAANSETRSRHQTVVSDETSAPPRKPISTAERYSHRLPEQFSKGPQVSPG